MYRAVLLTIGVALILPACRSREDADAPDSAVDSAAMAGMTGMSSDDMMRHMMDSTDVLLRMMDTASAATMQATMPMYHRMADSMITGMDADMRKMNMATDAAWTATVDSVRQDLGRMSGMNHSDMLAMMPAHRARITRLMQVHRSMMGKPPR